jgi:hypothetical protein
MMKPGFRMVGRLSLDWKLASLVAKVKSSLHGWKFLDQLNSQDY